MKRRLMLLSGLSGLLVLSGCHHHHGPGWGPRPGVIIRLPMEVIRQGLLLVVVPIDLRPDTGLRNTTEGGIHTDFDRDKLPKGTHSGIKLSKFSF